MTARRPGYRSQRRPQPPVTTTRPSDFLAARLARSCATVAAAPEPKDCPRCDGAGTGCGACGGLGFLAGEEWKRALQLAFVHAAGLVLPCEAEGGGEAA